MEYEGITVLLPWLILGVIVLIGGITVVVTRLPWVTKAESAMAQELVEQRFIGIMKTQEVTATQLAGLTLAVAELAKQSALLQQRMDDFLRRST